MHLSCSHWCQWISNLPVIALIGIPKPIANESTPIATLVNDNNKQFQQTNLYTTISDAWYELPISHYQVALGRARMLEMEKNESEAEKMFILACRLSPHLVQPFAQLGNFYLKQGDSQGLLKCCLKVIELYSDSPWAQKMMDKLLTMM